MYSIPKFDDISSELDSSRNQLRRKAKAWRAAEKVGLLLHRLAPPIPIVPSLIHTLPTTVSPIPGNITIQFYTPPSYELRQATNVKYPIVINFHGGGFTLGAGTDDSRWATAVVNQSNAIVASVDYRLAPEYPFPTAVEDGVDAVFWLVEHAEELAIDPHRIAISGFSAGGNLCFTVPLRLHEELQRGYRRTSLSASRQHSSPILTRLQPQNPSSLTVPASRIPWGRSLSDIVKLGTKTEHVSPATIQPGPESKRPPLLVKMDCPVMNIDLTIVGIVAWYPPVDYRMSRDDRSATNLRPGAGLPRFLTRLFDDSYLQTPDSVENPYCSPAAATEVQLKAALPRDIMIYTCEYDDLRQEAEDFSERLRKYFGKSVIYKMIKGVPHGWDKAPNPLWPPRQISELYEAATTELQRWFSK